MVSVGEAWHEFEQGQVNRHDRCEKQKIYQSKLRATRCLIVLATANRASPPQCYKTCHGKHRQRTHAVTNRVRNDFVVMADKKLRTRAKPANRHDRVSDRKRP